MSKEKRCLWHCGRTTDRRCGVCLTYCDQRDERNRQIDAGLIPYTPPSKRPGHRFYEGSAKKVRTDKQQRAAMAKAHATRATILLEEMPVADL